MSWAAVQRIQLLVLLVVLVLVVVLVVVVSGGVMVDRATSTILTIRQMQLTIDDRAVVMVTIVMQVEEKEEGMVGCEAGERLRLVEPAPPALLVDILVAPAPVAGLPLLWKLVELVGKCLSRYTCLLS